MSEKWNIGIEEYFLNNFDIDRLYSSIEKSDFFFLHHIYLCGRNSECEDGVYLSELAAEMKLPMPNISKAVKRLQEKGYIEWNMTPDRDRTYVDLTSNAIELMHDEREKMRKIYERIKAEIPEADLERTVATVRRINEIVADVGGK